MRSRISVGSNTKAIPRELDTASFNIEPLPTPPSNRDFSLGSRHPAWSVGPAPGKVDFLEAFNPGNEVFAWAFPRISSCSSRGLRSQIAISELPRVQHYSERHKGNGTSPSAFT